MNEDFKAKWVAALRSGEFTQTDGRLRRGDSYCCLGVACELYRQEVGRGEWTPPVDADGIMNEIRAFAAPGETMTATLPMEVWEYLGFRSGDPTILPDIQCVSGNSLSYVSLATLNDNGFTFDQIADIIDYFA